MNELTPDLSSATLRLPEASDGILLGFSDLEDRQQFCDL
jgi:hypothetical protein